MDLATQRLMMGAAGVSDDPVYVEDVYFARTRKGTGNYESTFTDPPMDLVGEGGSLWIKNKSQNGTNWQIFDTERGANKHLYFNSQNQEGTTNNFPRFITNGYGTGENSNTNINNNSQYYVDYVLRKAPGFFDIIKYTANGSAQTLSHNLKCIPGMVIQKTIDAAGGWRVYHKHLSDANKNLLLNSDVGEQNFGGTGYSATSSAVTLPAQDSGDEIIVYLFADGDNSDSHVFGEDKDEEIVKTGTYNGNGNSWGPHVTIGWEPQFVLIKRVHSSQTADWSLFDDARGGSGGFGISLQKLMYANQSYSDISASAFYTTPTGFQLTSNNNQWNLSEKYVYLAIRRADPAVSKPIEDEGQLFCVDDGTAQGYFETNNKFDIDFAWTKNPTSTDHWQMMGRKWQGRSWRTNYPDGEGNWQNNSTYTFSNRSFQMGTSTIASTSRIAYMWRRSDCFNVFVYRSSGDSNWAVPHGLTTTPLMIWIRPYTRQGVSNPMNESNTFVFHYYTGEGASAAMSTFSDDAAWDYTNHSKFGSSWPNNTNFYLGNGAEVNRGGGDYEYYVAMVWSNKTGYQKLYYYNGNGSSSNSISTGFQPRLIMIKCASHSGEWFVFDTKHGITNGGNERPTNLRRAYADTSYTNQDWIDISSSGFQLKTSDNQVNGSGRRYVYMAVK